MKKILLIVCLLMLVGCAETTDNGNLVDADTGASVDADIGAAVDADIDVDLTVLSRTMLPAEFNNIIMNSRDYLGKTIKVSGSYYTLYFEPTNRQIHYITIVDGDACCRQGFEFELGDGYAYPADYPRENAMIEVIGVFSRYRELDTTYYYLEVDHISS